jgi:histone H2A
LTSLTLVLSHRGCINSALAKYVASDEQQSVSLAARAGLHFSVGLVHRNLQKSLLFVCKVSRGASICMAASLQSIMHSVLSGCRVVLEMEPDTEVKVTRFTPRTLQLAIRGNPELIKVLSVVTISTQLPILPSLSSSKTINDTV